MVKWRLMLASTITEFFPDTESGKDCLDRAATIEGKAESYYALLTQPGAPIQELGAPFFERLTDEFDAHMFTGL